VLSGWYTKNLSLLRASHLPRRRQPAHHEKETFNWKRRIECFLAEGREAELERKIGQLTMENDFLKKVRSFEEQQAAVNGGAPSI